jgi:isopentenyldiphosphate isomerase
MSFAEQLARLQAFLDADELHEEALDYVAAHGYLTALSICPDEVPEREWIDALFAEPPLRSEAQRSEIEAPWCPQGAHRPPAGQRRRIRTALRAGPGRRAGRFRPARLVHRFHGRRVPA